ncbi:DUF4350 domain-containing protein [Agromyces aerolatus]|uniref:DUF4350 domain-containing protein n=1 Tax=Agromyces sp. LY-1074 TaxID=3074080 RepID=UPI00285AD989|nr:MULTISPECIES: DUF4350 domain-containing protein [unclassified Agromyces]MDR5699842.1 DUF4350 domain-containing protein [Agromyces sp. LY-1074]MDR5706346.1 DUF4350 domain-containing protein [Agromyces sp. LY-1358]
MSAPTATHQRPGPPSSAPARTPTLRAGLRRRRIWIVLAVVLVLGGAALIAVRGFGGVGRQPLGPADPSPAGAKAVVEVLRGQGVDVIEARSLERALDAAPGATVLVYDDTALLGEDALDELAGTAEGLVVVEPDFSALRTLAPGVRHAGAASGPIDDAACDLPVATRAGGLSDRQRLLTIDDDAAARGWTGCFGDGDAFALVSGSTEQGAELAIVGASTVFANGSIDESGNAALALGLAGARPTLVWYLPGPADADSAGPSLAELTPGWVSPFLVLAVVVTIAAGVWRGRRLGRLVVEDLPVEVRAGETDDGRARLYAAASSRTHALDQLRIGAIGRLRRTLRLPSSATAAEVAGAAAAATGEEAGAIRRLLLDAEPATDRALVDLAVALGAFEQRVRDAIRPGSARTDRPRTDPPDSPTGRRS